LEGEEVESGNQRVTDWAGLVASSMLKRFGFLSVLVLGRIQLAGITRQQWLGLLGQVWIGVFATDD
jgi:hypothetical protein